MESIEIRAIVKGVPQAARMVHPEEPTIEFDDVPDDVQFSPFFVNVPEDEPAVETPVVETPVVETPVEPPAPAPEDLVVPPTPVEPPVVDPAPVVEVTPSADVTPSIPPTIDVATE